MQKLDTLLSKYIEDIITYIPEIVTSLFILGLGLWMIRFLQRLAKKIFLKKNIDPTFSSFILDMLIWGMRILLFVIIASK